MNFHCPPAPVRRFICISLVLGACGFVPSTGRAVAEQPAAGADAGFTVPDLPPGDPMEFTIPAAMPPLADPLSDVEFAARCKVIEAGGPIDVNEAAGRPLTSVGVLDVCPKGLADVAGVRPGDIVDAVDGNRARFEWELFSMCRPYDQNMRMLTSGKQWSFKAPLAQIGVYVRTRWDAVAAWGRCEDHDVRYDRLIQIAARAWETDGDLAQSALARAQKAGCSGYMLPAIACMLAYKDCRLDDVLTFGALTGGRLPPSQMPAFEHVMFAAAVMNFKLEYAMRLVDSDPTFDLTPVFRSTLVGMIAAYRQRPRINCSNPLHDVSRFEFVNARKQLISLTSASDDPDGIAARDLRLRGLLNLSTPSDQSRWLAFGPAGANVDAAVDVTFFDTDRELAKYDREFRIGVVDQNDGNRTLAAFKLLHNGTLMHDPFDYRAGRLDLPSAADRHWRIRLVVLDQRCELIVNGRRAFFGPINLPEHDRKLGLEMQVIGVVATIHKFAWRIAPEQKGN